MSNSNQLVAKAINGSEIVVSLVPSKKMQNTREGFIWVNVGLNILLESGREIELNQDRRSFYTALNQMYYLPHRV
ncbi:hypothetical protein A6M14_13190 [Acinetobacter sp. Ac_877]|uniref:hypothetical protein n=1 Tax=Acinetobacter TaxID=469 RepID=UPI00128E6989|nr:MULTISPECIES: hypothetical protein [Acinetobacter]MDY6467587.1 hypothetical protein [Acinetobacter faecalis]MPW42647.1 hypothetical protein [Acinetobacter portensis]